MKVFVVMGCHRSATSLVAKGLHDAGVDMGRDLLGPAESNPHGHYECTELVNINELILKQADGSWDKPPSRGAILSVAHRFDDEIREYLKTRSRSEMWGMKDPRLCLTWPIWGDALWEEQTDVHLIPVMRPPWNVAQSLHARNGGEHVKWVRLWEIYHERIMSNINHWTNAWA